MEEGAGGQQRRQDGQQQESAGGHNQGNQPTGAAAQLMKAKKPQMALLIEKLIEQQGIEYYEKNVVAQLMEFISYYSSELLQEAKVLKDISKKKAIDINDMRMAIYSRSLDSFQRPLSLNFLRGVANEKNTQNLPKIDLQTSTDKLTSFLPTNENC